MSASRTGRRVTVATTVAGVVVAPLAVFGATAPAHSATPVEIQILATNDFHGRLAQGNNNPEAGAAILAGAVKDLRGTNPNTVFAAAGDLIGATTFDSFIAHDRPTIESLNEAGLEVSAVGNHEFDKGYDDLVNRVMKPHDPVTNPYGGAGWKYLGANVRFKDSGDPALPKSWIKDFGNGVQVGFVGAVTEHLGELVSPAGISELEVRSIVGTANRTADDLKAEGADIVVLLVHEGAEDTSYAKAVDPATDFGKIVNGVNANIDAIVSGHTHLSYDHEVPVQAWADAGRAVTTRPVVSAGQYGSYLNQLVYTVDPDPDNNPATDGVKLTDLDVDTLELTGVDPDKDGPLLAPPLYTVDANTKAIVAAAKAYADVQGNVKVGKIAGAFNRAQRIDPVDPAKKAEARGAESTLGNMVAEVQRWATSTPEAGSAQIAFMNPGGLRKDLVGTLVGGAYPADVTYRQAADVQPFANTLVNLKMTGATIKKVLEQQWQPAGAARPFLRMGTSKGFAFTYDPDRTAGDRITGMWLNGVPLVSTTTYSVTANSFLATGGDNFTAFKEASSKRDTGKVDLESMVEFMKQNHATTPLAVDPTQHAVGVDWAATAPASYKPGDTVAFALSSLSFTTAADKTDSQVKVALGTTELGSFPVTTTLTSDAFDEVGTAAVSAKLPATASAGPAVLTVTGQTTGTVVRVPITVAANPTTVPAATKLRVKVKPKRVVVRKTRARVVVRVLSDAGTPQGGRVVVKVAGKRYVAKVDDGRAVVKLKRFTKARKYRVVVKFRGTKKFAASKKVFKLRVVRRG